MKLLTCINGANLLGVNIQEYLPIPHTKHIVKTATVEPYKFSARYTPYSIFNTNPNI